MTVPASEELPLLRPGPFTRTDLEAMPDDGHRYEILDGVLVVTPAPTPKHQRAVTRIWRTLADACPPNLEAFVAPLDVILTDDTVLEPDVLVAKTEDLTDRGLTKPPVLAIEVLSPSTRRYDLLLKRSRYEAAGTPSYWVVDPDEPSIIAWELRDGVYGAMGQVKGNETLEVSNPYKLRITPTELVQPS